MVYHAIMLGMEEQHTKHVTYKIASIPISRLSRSCTGRSHVVENWCAVSARTRLLRRSRRSRAKNLLGQLTYLASKDKGDNSMSVTRINAKVCSVTHRKSCTHG